MPRADPPEAESTVLLGGANLVPFSDRGWLGNADLDLRSRHENEFRARSAPVTYASGHDCESHVMRENTSPARPAPLQKVDAHWRRNRPLAGRTETL